MKQSLKEMRRRYVETGSETRFPFYGKDYGYEAEAQFWAGFPEVDYMLELGLQSGDRCSASYRLEAL